MDRTERRRGLGPATAWWSGLAVILVLCGVTAGCRIESKKPGGPTASNGRFRIVTTCGMVTDLVKAVVGERAEVIGLLGEGVDPHLYKPTAHDVKELTSADIVFYSGLMLEGRMEEAFEQVKSRGREVHAVTDDLDRSKLLSPPEFAGHHDPHVWMDISLWSECVRSVGRRMKEIDPAGGEEYVKNAEAYCAQLTELDEYVRQIVTTIPKEQRVLVTAHDAFGYFSRAYDIEVKSAQGISTESEPGVNDINELVEFLVSRKVKAIFVESSVSSANLQAVIEGAGSRGWQVTIGGELFSDAMGKPGTYEGTYLGMLDHNATTIVQALGGTAPARGWKDQLSVEESTATK